MKKLDIFACILLMIGGLNWGLVGFFDFNFVEYFICRAWLFRVLYVLIGFAALYTLATCKGARERKK